MMKLVARLLLMIIPLAIAGVKVMPAAAQSSSKPVLFAEVDRTSISTDDTIILTVTVDMFESSLSKPQMPALTGFDVIGRNNGSQISMINGDMTVQETYQYYLRPVQAGDLVIEPITLSVNGKTYSTDPIIVQVSQGTGSPSPVPQPARPSFPNFPAFPNFPSLPNFPTFDADIPLDSQPMDPAMAPAELAGKNYFLEAVADNQTPYQGEQVLYTVRFYTSASPTSELEYIEPSYTGFWHEPIPEEKHLSLRFGNQAYNVIELETVLFPTVVGTVEIPPAQIRIPADFFTSGGTLQTKPLPINVQTLPSGAPSSFYGAVGNFDINSEVDMAASKVNEPITHKVTISGSGNIENISEPFWQEVPEFRSFDTTVDSSTRFENSVISGEIVFERLLVPTRVGKLNLPPVEFSYFNPEIGSYQTVSTQAIEITVESDGIPSADIPSDNNPVNLDYPSNTDSELIKIKPALKTSLVGTESLVNSPVYWILFALPLFLFAGFSAWQHYSRRWQGDADYLKYKGAAKKASLALKRIEREPGRSYSKAGKILIEYLSEKLNQPLAGLTLSELGEVLKSFGLNKELSEQVLSCIELSEMGSYSPELNDKSSKKFVKQIEELISGIDREL